VKPRPTPVKEPAPLTSKDARRRILEAEGPPAYVENTFGLPEDTRTREQLIDEVNRLSTALEAAEQKADNEVMVSTEIASELDGERASLECDVDDLRAILAAERRMLGRAADRLRVELAHKTRSAEALADRAVALENAGIPLLDAFAKAALPGYRATKAEAAELYRAAREAWEKVTRRK
jgi:hypothetical protein